MKKQNKCFVIRNAIDRTEYDLFTNALHQSNKESVSSEQIESCENSMNSNEFKVQLFGRFLKDIFNIKEESSQICFDNISSTLMESKVSNEILLSILYECFGSVNNIKNQFY